MKALFQRLTIGLISLIASIAMVEITLRIWTPDSLQYKAVRRADPIMHHSLVPSSRYTLSSDDFTVEVKTNSLGFRDREHIQDPADAYRVIILGDSFVEGYGVRIESCFVHKLEVKLNAERHVSTPISVYGLGVAGYSPIIEYLLLKQRGLKMDPNIVVLFYDMNDVQEDFLYAEDTNFDSMGMPLRVNPSWPSFGHVTLVPRGSFKTFLNEKSYFFMLVANALNRLKPKPLYEEGNIFAGPFMHTVDSTSGSWEKYFQQSQSYVKLTADLCKANGIPFVLVTYPRGNQVNSLEWTEGRKYWGLDSLVHNSAIFSSMQKFAEKNGVSFLNMTPVFRARSKGDLYYPIDGHWSSAGHSVAADTLAVFLKNNHFVPN